MTDVIRKSGVSIAGVYYNYKSKDDILLDIVQEPINETISALTDSIFDNMETTYGSERSINPPSMPSSPPDWSMSFCAG